MNSPWLVDTHSCSSEVTNKDALLLHFCTLSENINQNDISISNMFGKIFSRWESSCWCLALFILQRSKYVKVCLFRVLIFEIIWHLLWLDLSALLHIFSQSVWKVGLISYTLHIEWGACGAQGKKSHPKFKSKRSLAMEFWFQKPVAGLSQQVSVSAAPAHLLKSLYWPWLWLSSHENHPQTRELAVWFSAIQSYVKVRLGKTLNPQSLWYVPHQCMSVIQTTDSLYRLIYFYWLCR